jgi:hypothetical protein
VREPKEVERLRFAETPSASIRNRGPAELDEPRLIGMKGESEAREPRLEIAKELLCLMSMLEADDGVVRIANDNHVAGGASLSPLLGPEIVDVVEVDVRQQWAYYSTLRRPLLHLDHLAVFEYTAANHLRISLTTRRSPIRCSTKRTNQCWLTVSKNARMSASRTQPISRLPIPYASASRVYDDAGLGRCGSLGPAP